MNRATPLSIGRMDTTSRQAKLMTSVNETFMRSLEGTLASTLNAEVKVTSKEIGITTPSSFRRELRAPTVLILLRLNPRSEKMVLHIDASTVLLMIEMLLGGKGETKPEARELTNIEWNLLEELIRVMVRSLGEAWTAYHAVEFEVESLGCDPTFLNLPESSQPLTRLSFEMHLGEQYGEFEIALPQTFFESDSPAAEPAQELALMAAGADVERNVELLGEARVHLDVTLDGPTMVFEELMQLRPGQVVTFDYPIHKPLQATLNGVAPMTGHIVGSKQKRAFQIERTPSIA